MSPFKDKVIQIVRSVPHGKVVSYGQVAAYAGSPRAAREVGWTLNGLEGGEDLPWWRVLNNKGYLSIRGNQTADKSLQKKLLEAEGIVVDDEYQLDMEEYRFKPDLKTLKSFSLSEAYIKLSLGKYGL